MTLAPRPGDEADANDAEREDCERICALNDRARKRATVTH